MLLCRLALFAIAALAASSEAVSAPAPLTPDGWGELRVGMRERDAVRLFGLHIPRDDGVSSYDCRQEEVPHFPGLVVMAERGVVTRITIEPPSRLRTDRGIGIGSREADVKRAYGPALKIVTAAYQEEPAHDLTFWAPGGKRGVRIGTNAAGRVEAIYVGSRSISYIEGCL
jgi:hypothetical protein